LPKHDADRDGRHHPSYELIMNAPGGNQNQQGAPCDLLY
jgi:hypothetical protein